MREVTPRPSQGEALAVWALLLADALAVLAVYSMHDSTRLYAVSREGLEGGLSRALVLTNFPISLIAIPLALLALQALPRKAWLAGAPAIALCAVTAISGVVDPDDLDARWVNVLPAAGAALALALTVAAARRVGVGFAPARRGDPLRVAAAALAILVSLPWIAAELGVSLPRGVFLTTQLYAEPGELPSAAVHIGHHHGFAGTLFVLSALLLSRPRIHGRRLRAIYAALVSLTLVYGASNLAQDFWHEQLVKRGWTSWDIPSVLEPALTVMWGLVLAVAALVFALGFARRDGSAPSGDNPR
ncbi:MAG TPA: hypothetical protein VK926_04540 [Gaiellaceae bacterium]|nr:hypothetical protein [Gaiellaceae bacterium]